MKVNDIRPDALLAGQQAAAARHVTMLQSWAREFVVVNCPAS